MNQKLTSKNWKIAVITVVLLTFASYVIAGFIHSDKGNVALIRIEGPILTSSGLVQSTITSDEIVRSLESASRDSKIKAILLEINSPGGTAVASKEVADAITRINKTTVSLIREVGASGAYWIASATDHIIANDLSITGSIGVIGSYLEFEGFISRYGINYRRMVAGNFKDIGNPLKNQTMEEGFILQSNLDYIHEYFIQEIAKNRKIPADAIAKIADGRFYLGKEAYQLGLIDELGDMETARNRLKLLGVNEVEFVRYTRNVNLINSLLDRISLQSYILGKGIADGLKPDTTIRI